MFPRALPWALTLLVCLAGCFDELQLYVPPEDASTDATLDAAPADTRDASPPLDIAPAEEGAPDAGAPDLATDLTPLDAPTPDAGPADASQDLLPDRAPDLLPDLAADLPVDLAADVTPDTAPPPPDLAPDLKPGGESCSANAECANNRCLPLLAFKADPDTCTSGWRDNVPGCGVQAVWWDLIADPICRYEDVLKIQGCVCELHL